MPRQGYGRVQHQGHTFDRRTLTALRWAEQGAGFTFPIAQGSYNTGRVSASAGTHDGGGAVDIGCASLNKRQIRRALRWLKRAGFAAWYRPALPGVWGPHIHAVQRGNKKLSWLAARQVRDFDRGRDGLAGDRPDPSFRPKPRRIWNFTRKRPRRMRR